MTDLEKELQAVFDGQPTEVREEAKRLAEDMLLTQAASISHDEYLRMASKLGVKDRRSDGTIALRNIDTSL